LIATQAIGQHCALDASFGVDGYKSYSAYSSGAFANPESAPINMFYLDDKYTLVQIYQVTQFNLDGTRNPNFGISGKAVVAKPNHYFTIKSAKLGNESIYVCGSVNVGGSSNQDAFVAKMDLNGAFDNSFGDSGVAIFEISNLDGMSSDNDELSDILIRPDGSIYVTGKSISDIVLAKLTSSGAVDLTFEASGFKSFGPGKGTSLLNYQDGMLLINTNGTTKIDDLGNVDVNFGVGGTLQLGGGLSPAKVKPTVDTLFYIRSHYFGSPGWGGYAFYTIIGYDINTFQSITSTIEATVFPGITMDGNKLLVTDANTYLDNNVDTFFRIRRFNPNGTLDNSFANSGSFIYMLPVWLTTIYASVSYLHDDGKIFIAGYDQHQNATTYSHGLGMIRIVDTPLSVNENFFNQVILYPNPAIDKIFLTNFNHIESITLSDLSGKKIHCKLNDDGSFVLDGLMRGVYFMELGEGIDKKIMKFIKQ
jgi:uncharacterized delta-60 repeat protein